MTFTRAKSLTAFSGATLMLFVVLMLLPLLILLARSVWLDGRLSLDAYLSVLSDKRQWGLFVNSLVVAACTTGLAVVLGVPLAFALGYVRVPTWRALMVGVSLPLLVPPYISAIAWVDAFGIVIPPPESVAALDAVRPNLFNVFGCVMVLGFAYYPIVTFVVYAALRRYSRRLEEPARLVTRQWAIVRAITLPLLGPSIFSGALAVFVVALVEFSVPSLLQINVYAVEIFTRFSVSFDPAEAMAQASPLLVVGAVAIAGWSLYANRHRGRLTGNPGDLGDLVVRHDHSAWAWAGASWVLVGLTAVVPPALLVRRSLPLTSYIEVWQTAREEIATSLVVSIVSASCLVTLAGAMTLLDRFKRPTSSLYRLSALSYLVSGPLLAVGLIVLWNHVGPAAFVYDTLMILVVATVARYAFFVHQVLIAALHDVPTRYDEAAAACGVGWWRTTGRVLAPLMTPALVAAWGLGFVLAMRELDAAVLLAPPGNSTLAVRLFGLMHYGPSRLVAALSVVSMALVVAGAGASALLYVRLQRSMHGRH